VIVFYTTSVDVADHPRPVLEIGVDGHLAEFMRVRGREVAASPGTLVA
jgi:hypothetical protein